MERKVLEEALRLATAHQPYVLATVVDCHGSVPGKKGATLLLREDGSFVGTVGGASLEEKVKFFARQALRRHEGGLHRFDLMAWKPGGLESICGGSVDIAVQYVAPRPYVLFWGGGHVALALARQLHLLDFDYAVADDRAEFVTEERFPHARHRWLVDAKDLLAKVEGSHERFTHVYLLGYDARKDQEAAFRLLPTFPGKVGLIGSRTKRELTRKALAARGLSEGVLDRLRSPIGVPMGAETPEEIAVSIAGEIIQDLHPTRTREGTPETTEAGTPQEEKGRAETDPGQA